MRVGVAGIAQETNTFSPRPTTIADFEAQGIVEGEEVLRFAGTNTEVGGALERVAESATAVPLVRAWAMSGGRVTAATLEELATRLRTRIRAALPLDGLVLSLHGAMAAEAVDDADLALLRAAREELGPQVPIGVCLDLHANVTAELAAAADFVVGYRTYPHVDMAETGARAASLLLDALEGRRRPVTRIAKRAMLTPAEAQGGEGPLGELRAAADTLAFERGLLDVSLFPVQPWLDVEDLGTAVTVTADGDADAAQAAAEELAEQVWRLRERFVVELVPPQEALVRVRASANRPVLLSESADSPTAGATADSPAMVGALLEHGRDLRSVVTLVDPPSVARCVEAGEGARVSLRVGCTFDTRFHEPVPLEGVVRRVSGGSFRLTGPVFTGMELTMGRYAVVEAGSLSVLLTERPAPTFDPEAFRRAGLRPEQADLVVVRSATLFRAGWAGVADEAIILDLPGASTPRLASLAFTRAPRPLYPVDA